MIREHHHRPNTTFTIQVSVVVASAVEVTVVLVKLVLITAITVVAAIVVYVTAAIIVVTQTVSVSAHLRGEAGVAALDVEELLHADVRSEASLRDAESVLQ